MPFCWPLSVLDTTVGRPEKAIPAPRSALGGLARALREARGGLPYRHLAALTGYSAATLTRAASGEILPRREVVRSFAHACRIDIDEVDRLWLAAYREQRLKDGAAPPVAAPAVPLIRDLADLGAALAALRTNCGAPSFHTMHKRAERAGLSLSSSTAQRITARHQVPGTRRLLVAFLVACEVPELRHHSWLRAWEEARRRHKADAALNAEAMARREAQIAGTASGHITPGRAAVLVAEVGFRPAELYQGFNIPWTVTCLTCGCTLRVRLASVIYGADNCPVCAVSAHGREPDGSQSGPGPAREGR